MFLIVIHALLIFDFPLTNISNVFELLLSAGNNNNRNMLSHVGLTEWKRNLILCNKKIDNIK